MTTPPSNTQHIRPLSKVRWLASFPKSGNTWVRAFLANLLAPQGRPLTLQEISSMPFYTDAKPNDHAEKEYFGKAHRPYSEERHGTKPAIYIVRDPVDVVPSCASFFGVSIPRMAEEVAKDWPRHVQSWVGHASLFIRYEDMPRHFHTLAQHLSVPSDFESVVTAISHSAFDTLQQDEAEHGFAEASEKQKAFFRKGTTGSGREVLDPATVRKVIKGAGEWYHRFGYRD